MDRHAPEEPAHRDGGRRSRERQLTDLRPTNPTERDLYFHAQWDPDSTIYCLGASLRLPRTVDADRWCETFARVVGRYELARSRFALRDGEVVRLVEPEARLDVERLEVDADPRPAVDDWVRRPFELEAPGLVRLAHAHAPDGSQLALMAMPHAVVDAASAYLVFAATVAEYDGRPAANVAADPPADAGARLTRLFDSAAAEAHWRGILSEPGVPPAPAAASEPRELRAELDEETRRRLRGYCAERGAGVPAFLLAAFARALAASYPGHDRPIRVYNILSARELVPPRSVGCLYHVVPYRLAASEARPFDDLLAETAAYRTALGDRQYVSVALQRRLTGAEELRFFFNFVNLFNFGEIAGAGGVCTVRVHAVFPEDEVHLVVDNERRALGLTLHYSESAFPGGSALDRLVAQVAEVLGAAPVGRS